MNRPDPETSPACPLKVEFLSQPPEGVTIGISETGAIQDVNRILESALLARTHVLISSRESSPSPETVTEMLAALDQDVMTAFVSPRSNFLDCSALPSCDVRIPSRLATQEDWQRLHAHLEKSLSRFRYVSMASAHCCLIRWEILSCFGSFDENYETLAGALADLVLRANRVGHRTMLANRAFVSHVAWHPSNDPKEFQGWHFREALFVGLPESDREILDERFPEIPRAMAAWSDSIETRGERIFSEQALRADGGRTRHWLVDGRSLGNVINGTSRVIQQTLAGLCKRAVGTNVEISVLCSPEIAAFHDLSQHVGLRIVGEEEAYGFDLLYKPAQPFSMGEVADSSQRALRVVYCFLDTISWDCFYLWCQERDDCWRLASRCSDALFFISPFSEKQFHLRFETDPEVLTRVIPLSLDVRDYLPSTQCRPALETSPASQQKHLLVFGNHYAHKHVQATATSLALAFPDQEIVLFGMEEPVPHGNVRAIFSGRLDEAGLETLYQNSACLIFPSMYEGFGLPVMEGLARGMAVFARETPLNRWIGETCNAGGTLFLYRCDEDLCRGVASFLRQPKSRQTQGAMHSNGRSCEDGVQVIWDCFHELTSRSNLPQFWKRMERIPMPQPKPAALETPAHEPPSPEQKATVQTPALKPGRWSAIRRCPERVHREVLRSLRKIRRWIGGEEPPQSWTS